MKFLKTSERPVGLFCLAPFFANSLQFNLMVLAHLSKSNSRTFQELSRTTRRIYKDNSIKSNGHFYKHI